MCDYEHCRYEDNYEHVVTEDSNGVPHLDGTVEGCPACMEDPDYYECPDCGHTFHEECLRKHTCHSSDWWWS